MIFVTNMRKVREAAGMTQSDLAAAMTDAGYPWLQSTVNKVESITKDGNTGRAVKVGEAVAIARILNTTVDTLCRDGGKAITAAWFYRRLKQSKDAADLLQSAVAAYEEQRRFWLDNRSEASAILREVDDDRHEYLEQVRQAIRPALERVEEFQWPEREQSLETMYAERHEQYERLAREDDDLSET